MVQQINPVLALRSLFPFFSSYIAINVQYMPLVGQLPKKN